MLSVNFFKPKDSISWLVRKFETIKTDGKDSRMENFFIPRPDVALVFHFGDLPYILSSEKIHLTRVFIAPIHAKPLQINIEGKLDTFIVLCNASVLSRILGLDIKINHKPFIAVCDQRFDKLLYKELSVLKTDEDRINCFINHIQNIAGSEYNPDNIDRVYFDICENSLQKPLSKIIENARCSTSSLQRNFLKRTGVSMKKLIRIARVSSIFEKMLEENHFNYLEILFESNYYDQSHFIKDFKDLTGKNPTLFFKENSELCNILSGMYREKGFFNH